jgi:hypothetical protein
VPNASRIDLPRPAIIAAVGVLVLAVTFVLTHGKEVGTSSSAPAATTPSTTPSAATTTPTATSPTATSTTTTTTTTAKPAQPGPPPVQAGPGLPAAVARALNRHDVVVLFFYSPAAADDQATRLAISVVRGQGPRVRLFTDLVAHISSYRRVVGSLGISQTPAMVVIDRNRNALLLEGYQDAGTIRQTVTDAF